MNLHACYLSFKNISADVILFICFCTGNYDVVQQPRNIGETARSNVPFFMFIDEETETYMKNSSTLGSDKKVGLWRIIVVHNVPYTDSRRNGKVCMFLFFLHLVHSTSNFNN